MAYSVIPKTKRDGTLKLQDNLGTELTVSYTNGDMTFTPTKSAQVLVRSRGVIQNVRKGDDEAAASGSFSYHFRQFTDGSEAGAVLDFINKAGLYSSNQSTGGSGSPRVEEYCIDIVLQVAGSAHGDDADHSVTLTKCICNASFAEGDVDAMTIDFTTFGTVTYSGPA